MVYHSHTQVLRFYVKSFNVMDKFKFTWAIMSSTSHVQATTVVFTFLLEIECLLSSRIQWTLFTVAAFVPKYFDFKLNLRIHI